MKLGYSAFIAVNSGYNSEKNTITCHFEAQKIVSTLMQDREYSVLPGRVVWSASRGCQENGSPVGLVFHADGSRKAFLIDIQETQKKLNIITVGVTDDNTSEPNTECFVAALGIRNIEEASNAWRQEMEKRMARTGMEVSGAFWLDKDQLYFQSTINPGRPGMKEKWEEYVKNLVDIYESCFAGSVLEKYPAHYTYLAPTQGIAV